MNYYFTKTLSKNFEESVVYVTEALAKEGFGIITEIDITGTFKKKLDVDFKKYRILGACSPSHAYKAIQAEDKIGTMLPCNVIVQESSNGHTEITAIDPLASMMAVGNPSIEEIAKEIQAKLKKVIGGL